MKRAFVVLSVVIAGVALWLYLRHDDGAPDEPSQSVDSTAKRTAGDRHAPKSGPPARAPRDLHRAPPSPATGTGLPHEPSSTPPAPHGRPSPTKPAPPEPRLPQPHLTAEQQRAKKIRYLIMARRTVARLKQQLGPGAKNAEVLQENQRSLERLERWAANQSISKEELEQARAEIARQQARDAKRHERRPR